MNQLKKKHHEFIKSDQWKQIRKRLFSIRGKKCEKCGNDIFVEVHHLTYERFGGNELDLDLIILCRECHKKAHGKPNKKDFIYYRTRAISKYGLKKSGNKGWCSLAKTVLSIEGIDTSIIRKNNAERFLSKYLE